MSSAVPDGWQLAPLSNHASRIRSKNDIGNTNVLTASAIDGLINQREYFNKSVASADISHYTFLRKGDFAYNKSYSHGYPVGVVRRLERYDFGVLSPLYICFSIDSDECDQTYLSYYFDSHRFERELNSVVQEGARAHGLLNIPVNDFFDRELLLPPLPEQKKIASILTSVDEVIENTQKQIDKLQDLKKATMNELLTKGIGHTEFKDSELGRIPKSWEVHFLDDVTKRGSGHTPAKQNPSYWNGGIKWVSLADSSRLDKGFIYETDKEISEEGLANSSAVLHPVGAVVLSRDAGVGKSGVLAEEMAVSQHFMAWHCENRTDGWFLYYWMQRAKPIFEAVAIGSTIKTIGLGYFKKLKMACPPFQEQKSIAKRLFSIDEHIDRLKDKLSQTQSLKKSLMQDLLTGKVRVMVN